MYVNTFDSFSRIKHVQLNGDGSCSSSRTTIRLWSQELLKVDKLNRAKRMED